MALQQRGRHLRHSARWALFASFLVLATPGVSRAQMMSRLAFAARAEEEGRSASSEVRANLRVDSVSRASGHPILRGAGVGAVVGAAAGLVYAVIIDTQSTCNLPRGVGCTEDERALAYIVLPIYGTMFGAVVGGVVGALRR